MTLALILLQLAVAAALVWVATRRNVSPILSVSLVLAFLLWYVAPVATLLIAPERIIPRMAVTEDDFLRQALLETAAFLLTLIAFAVGRRAFRSIVDGRLASERLTPGRYSAAVIAGALVYFIVRHAMLSITGSTYMEINAFNVLAEGSSAAGRLGLLAFAEGVLLAFSYACAVTPSKRGPMINLILWAWIIGGTISVLLVGGRLALLTPAALLLMYLHERRTPAKVLLAVYGGLFVTMATVGVIVTIAIANVRGDAPITVSEAERQSKEIVADSSFVRERIWEAFDHVNLKFDRISAGKVLVERYGSGVAGAKPYVGALLAFVPRSLMLSKPVPGSVDETNRGTPSRLAAAALGYDPDVGNVGVSPAAIAMWQFGSLGLIPLVILNVLKLALINSLLLPRSVFTRTLAMFVIIVPTFEGVFSPADLLIMNTERVLAVYAAATLALYAAAQLRRRRLPRSAAAVPTR
jgi:hypothetical protein